VSANRRQAASNWARLGARSEHDGYRLQIHVRDGRVRLYTINGANWSKRYPLVVRDAARIEGSAIIDAEVVWLDSDGMAVFDALHSRVNDAKASACAFDLMMLNGEDLRRKPYVESNTSNTLRVTAINYLLPPASSGWRALSQRSSTRRISLGRRKLGLKSKIRRHRQLHAP
jgi:ATP dependent DNA ligase domain